MNELLLGRSVGARRLRGMTLHCLGLLLLAGCAPRSKSLSEAFPTGRYASPWLLQGEVWSGAPDEAATGLGNEAETIRALGPERVWLAVYEHENRSRLALTVRAYAFASEGASQSAYDRLHAPDAKPFAAGTIGCWTNDGLLIRWGRLVIEIFGNRPQDQAGPEQAVYLWAFFERALPENPQ